MNAITPYITALLTLLTKLKNMESKDKNPEEDTDKDNLIPNPDDFDEGDYEDINDNIPDLESDDSSQLKDGKTKKDLIKNIFDEESGFGESDFAGL